MARRNWRPPGSSGDERAWHDLDDKWMDEGVCRTDPEAYPAWFFPPAPDSSVKARFCKLSAKECCGRCPVQIECLQYALDGGLMGIWGGATDAERRRMVGKTRGPRQR